MESFNLQSIATNIVQPVLQHKLVDHATGCRVQHFTDISAPHSQSNPLAYIICCWVVSSLVDCNAGLSREVEEIGFPASLPCVDSLHYRPFAYDFPLVAVLSTALQESRRHTHSLTSVMSARIPTLSQLPLNLQHEIADFVSREQVSALQELLKETRPSREMSTWPPKDPREIIEALGERTLDDVREIFIDIGLDDVLPLLDDARRRQRRSNMMSRSIANGDASLSDQTSSMSSSSSNASDSSRHSQGKSFAGTSCSM